mmetsp:Transcript_2824/g.8112  ORF Transcript_2824/g.8112 Transcript_2824/m.8112 type:complete len:345 (-) Transcript_2824:512-1546(-)
MSPPSRVQEGGAELAHVDVKLMVAPSSPIGARNSIISRCILMACSSRVRALLSAPGPRSVRSTEKTRQRGCSVTVCQRCEFTAAVESTGTQSASGSLYIWRLRSPTPSTADKAIHTIITRRGRLATWSPSLRNHRACMACTEAVTWEVAAQHTAKTPEDDAAPAAAAAKFGLSPPSPPPLPPLPPLTPRLHAPWPWLLIGVVGLLRAISRFDHMREDKLQSAATPTAIDAATEKRPNSAWSCSASGQRSTPEAGPPQTPQASTTPPEPSQPPQLLLSPLHTPHLSTGSGSIFSTPEPLEQTPQGFSMSGVFESTPHFRVELPVHCCTARRMSAGAAHLGQSSST